MFCPNNAFRLLTSILLAVALARSAHSAEAPLELYVSPGGNDAASGAQAQPFATLGRARDAVRELHKAPGVQDRAVRVILRGGTYFLPEPLTLTPEDSGKKDAPVIYAAYPDEKPVLSGGRRISGWQTGEVNGKPCWIAEVGRAGQGGEGFRELFVGGVRRPRPRLPREGFFRFAPAATETGNWQGKPESARFVAGDLKNWANLGDVDLVSLNCWIDGHNHIARVDEATSTVFFAPQATMGFKDSKGLPARYYVENVKEALSAPGEWYLDRPAGKLYYLPLPGETPEQTEVIAPRLPALLRLEGSPAGEKVRALRFENLAFCDSEPVVTNHSVQAACFVPASVQLANAENCDFYGCEFTRLGGYGAQVLDGCAGNRFIACRFEDLGAGGVRIESGSSHTTVADCSIRRGGRIWHSAVGVMVADSPRNRILRNHISDFYYTGISCGWVWGYGPTRTFDNRIEANLVHDIGGGMLEDMGGIYMLGTQAGTVLRGNVIHDVSTYNYGGWGLYTDEGSSFMLLEDNVVWHAQTGGFHQHYGRDNIVRNNIFAFGGENELMRTRTEHTRSFIFEKNIVYASPGSKLLATNWTGPGYMMRDNIYWRAGGGALDFAGKPFVEWQKEGQDRGSLVADPLLIDPGAFNFALEPRSPALALGFKPVSATQAGPRPLDPGKVRFEDWPATEDPVPVTILEGRLEAEKSLAILPGVRHNDPLPITIGKPCAVVYDLWNRGDLAATGQVEFRVEPPDAARIEGPSPMDYNLKPDEKMSGKLNVTANPGAPPFRLEANPTGPGLFATVLFFTPEK